jgi:hypothetical protein
MKSNDLQLEVFQLIKNKLPPHLSMVDEVASVLEISIDSAYRRIRGEKPLSLEEAQVLVNRYQLSFDQLLQIKSDGFVFTGNVVTADNFQFDHWLKVVMQQIKYISSFSERNLFYLLKDIPVFHHFHFREIAAFKHYVWMRGIMNSKEFSNRKFSLSDYPDELFQLGRQALQVYNDIDSVEIWNVETINSTMRQIDFYHESGLFENEEEVMVIYEALEKLLMHLDRQAELGYKFTASESSPTPAGRFQMYLNEMVIGDNSVLAVLDGAKIAFVVHTVMNLMTTRDLRFCENMYDSIQNLMKKSTLISSVSERERSRFFKYLRKRIANKKESFRV